MPKNLFEDIKPITRKPKDANPAPASQAPVQPPKQPPAFKQAPQPEQPTPITVLRRIPSTPLPRELPFEPREPRRSSRYALWYVAIACVIGFIFSLSFLFEHAYITVTPKSQSVSFDPTQTFTAIKDGTDPSTIVYTEMTLSDDASIKLPGTESKDQSVSATGTVVLYNAYSTSPYKLIKNTRLETPAGIVYHMDTAATIPGETRSGTAITPGSVEVNVTAALPGETGNVAESDLSVPGLSGTPQASKIYARTKTALSGGVSGTVYTIPEDTANAAFGTLQNQLKASLVAKAKVQVPDGYIYYDGATLFTSDNSVEAPYSTTADVPIALHGTLVAYLIKEDTLVSAIAQNSISQYNNEPVTIPDLGSLTLVPSASLDPANDASFTFSLSGEADIVWTVIPSDITTLLLGKRKADFEPLLGEITGVEKAELVLKPFWKMSFPNDPNRITVTVGPPSA